MVGTGDIGIFVIRIANGFGMDVLAFDVKQNHEAAEELGFQYVGMDELLSKSDVVTLHVPANPETEGMIGQEQFAARAGRRQAGGGGSRRPSSRTGDP